MTDEEAPAGEVENSFVDTDALSAGLTLLSDTAFLGAAVRPSGSRYGIGLEGTLTTKERKRRKVVHLSIWSRSAWMFGEG
jgi:hypothetical protein